MKPTQIEAILEMIVFYKNTIAKVWSSRKIGTIIVMQVGISLIFQWQKIKSLNLKVCYHNRTATSPIAREALRQMETQ